MGDHLIVGASRHRRRGRYNIPKPSCPIGVDPSFLDCFALSLRGMKAMVEYHMLAMTIKRSPIERDEQISKASGIMPERKIHHIAITDKGKIAGILSVKDLEEC